MDKIFKKIHQDGSETVIKQVKPAYREGGILKEKEKLVTSIFVSSSYGCPYACSFCHLTDNKTSFRKLSWEEVVSNVMETVEECSFVTEDTTLKVCWMGMGDPNINSYVTKWATQELIEKLDVYEVDISSVKYSAQDVEQYTELNKEVPVRLFYSLHSGSDAIRDSIMPKVGKISDSVKALSYVPRHIPIFIHYLPLSGVNDSCMSAKGVANVAKELHASVRMLEFNPAQGSEYSRPPGYKLDILYRTIQNAGVGIKWQVSKGKEDLASCGMFGGGK